MSVMLTMRRRNARRRPEIGASVNSQLLNFQLPKGRAHDSASVCRLPLAAFQLPFWISFSTPNSSFQLSQRDVSVSSQTVRLRDFSDCRFRTPNPSSVTPLEFNGNRAAALFQAQLPALAGCAPGLGVRVVKLPTASLPIAISEFRLQLLVRKTARRCIDLARLALGSRT
jgi:hypothetical protein